MIPYILHRLGIWGGHHLPIGREEMVKPQATKF